jgi:hypothetical protein
LQNRRTLREQIVACLRAGDFSGLVALAGQDAGVARQLLALLFAPDELLHWRAVEGLGQVAGAQPGQVQKLIGRLLYSLNEDSGSFGWGAAAALGEIGRHQLPLVADIVPMFCGLLEQSFSQAQMLWGIGRFGEMHPDRLGEVLPCVLPCLSSPDPLVRALAAWSLGKSGYRPAESAIRSLVRDESPVELYDGGEVRRTTVGQVAQDALAALAEN